MTKKTEIKPNLRQKRLAREAVKSLVSEKPRKTTKKQLLEMAGYNGDDRKRFNTPGYKTALIKEFEKQGITDEKITKKLQDLLNHENYQAVTNALDKIFKIRGDYAPQRSETKLTGEIDHNIPADSGDYMEYLKTRNKDKQIIEGEIVQ